jgi:hypothetical protein
MGIGVPCFEVNRRGLAAGALFSIGHTLPGFPAIIGVPDGTHYLSSYLKWESFDGLSAPLALRPFYMAYWCANSTQKVCLGGGLKVRAAEAASSGKATVSWPLRRTAPAP